MLDVHFSSGKDDWETPDDLFAEWDATFHFILDAAANKHNHKVARWFGPGGEAEDALRVEWPVKEGNIWLNPPYTRGVQEAFVRRANGYEEFEIGGVGFGVVCLLPARTDTKLFHEVIQPYGKITFLRGRVRFKGAPHSAPFPSMIVVF